MQQCKDPVPNQRLMHVNSYQGGYENNQSRLMETNGIDKYKQRRPKGQFQGQFQGQIQGQ